MTSSNGNISRVTGPLCGEFTGQFASQKPVTRSFDVFFDLSLNKRLSKQRYVGNLTPRAHYDVIVMKDEQMRWEIVLGVSNESVGWHPMEENKSSNANLIFTALLNHSNFNMNQSVCVFYFMYFKLHNWRVIFYFRALCSGKYNKWHRGWCSNVTFSTCRHFGTPLCELWSVSPVFIGQHREFISYHTNQCRSAICPPPHVAWDLGLETG